MNRGDILTLLHVVEQQAIDGLFDEEGGSVSIAAVLDELNKKNEAKAKTQIEELAAEVRQKHPEAVIRT